MNEKRIVLITGAGRGIGRATALAFAKSGASLYLSARSKNELEETAAAATKAGASVKIFPSDLADRKSLQQFVKNVSKELPHLDVLVNNAGTLKVAALSETTEEIWDRTMAVNLTAPFLLTQSLLPLLQKSKKPHLFNVLSIAARTPFPGSSAYCASKAGLLGLNGVLREEFRALNIKVTAVLPGATDTKMFDEIPGEYDRSGFVQAQDVGDAIVSAYELSRSANVDEIQITGIQAS